MTLALWVISILLAAADTLQTREGLSMGLRESMRHRRKLGLWGGLAFMVAGATASYASTFVWPERAPLANIALMVLCGALVYAIRQNAGVLDGDR